MNDQINMPNIWGQGAIFAYSGLEGKCSFFNSLCGTLMADCLGIQFRSLAKHTDKACFIVNVNDVFNIYHKAVTSDMIRAQVEDRKRNIHSLEILFVNENTIVMKSKMPMDARLVFNYENEIEMLENTILYKGEGNVFALSKKIFGEDITLALSYGKNAVENSVKALDADIENLIKNRLNFYKSLPKPKFKDQDEERLYYKCASILRSTTYTPDGKISYSSLTPDRFPHHAIWLWDTAFLVVGMKHISTEVSKQAVKAILECSQPDGFLPHMSTPLSHSKITQPPVLAWAALEIHNQAQDKEFLSSIYDKLAKYIEWDIKNRDINGNGLLEWLVNPLDPFCKCDESGMDNTPRFDEAGEMDCIDFSAFIANDMRCLAKIAEILGKEKERKLWSERFEQTRVKINQILWDDKDGFYYDRRLSDGQLHKVKSVASFITLFGGICDREKAQKMVEHLKNPNEFGTEFPIPTVSADDKTYPTRDMFRGTVWLNFNILIAMGLDDYGYHKEASELRQKTIDVIKQWYLNDGVIYEFYDSKNQLSPSRLSRKGTPLQPFMPEIRLQSVRDFSWGAAAVIDFLINRK